MQTVSKRLIQKHIYIFIAGILSFGFIPANLPISAEIRFVIVLLWSLFGMFYYPGWSRHFNTKARKILLCIFLLFFINSFIPAFRFNQNYLPTLIAMRTNLGFIFLMTLLKVGPSQEDFFKAFKYLSILALVSLVPVSIWPMLYRNQESLEYLKYAQQAGLTNDIFAAFPGSKCLVFYFYIMIYKLIKGSKFDDFVLLSVFMLYIFIQQNRSTLICAAPFYLYAIFRSKIKYKTTILSTVIVVALLYSVNIVMGLWEESVEQLGNEDYNRWQAVEFFLVEHKQNFITYLFGNGVPCNGSYYLSYMMKAQTERLAFISDLGLVGTYFWYGILGVGIMYRFVFSAIKNKYMPEYLKYYAIWILLVPTIHSYGLSSFSSNIFVSIFFYLVLMTENNHKLALKQKFLNR